MWETASFRDVMALAMLRAPWGGVKVVAGGSRVHDLGAEVVLSHLDRLAPISEAARFL